MPSKTLLTTSVILASIMLWRDVGEAQTGYRLDRGRRQIVSSSVQQWNAWKVPTGTLTISNAGVQPRRWELNTNAVGDIVQFLQDEPPDYLSGKAKEEITLLDAISAGSNRFGVLDVLDGDPASYWEPDPVPEGADEATNWWFTIDLGRLVVANRIVVTFVEEGQGDPFYLFDVLTSDGQEPITAQGGGTIEFLPVLQVLEPNTNRRRFEIDFTEAPDHSREMVVRFLQVVVRDSRGDRAVEISQAEHERLVAESPEDAGLVDYTKLQRDGRELSVSQDNYERLSEDKQGPIRYYRRERPRLAEIEIWEEGQDLARDLLDRGGTITTFPKMERSPVGMFDGKILTNLPVQYDRTAFFDEHEVIADLGSYFWVSSVRLFMNLKGGGNDYHLGNHRLDLSDGSRRVDGSIDWVTIRRVERVTMADKVVEVSYPIPVHPTQSHVERHPVDEPLKTRFLRVAFDPSPVELYSSQLPFTELLVFGEGYQPQVTLESPLIDPQETRTLTSVEWDADIPDGTSIQLQTRTSRTKATIDRYFNGLGEEVTQEWYETKLRNPIKGAAIPENTLRGDIIPEEVMGSDSSAWSDPYFASGARITSPSPRDFVQIRATLLSDAPDAAVTLRAIRLNYAEPLADQLLGELTPTRIDTLAVPQPLSLYIRPDFSSTNPGLDGLLLTAPDGMELGFSRLYAGSEADLMSTATELEDLAVDALSLPTEGDSLFVTFPAIGPNSESDLLRLDFDGRLFSVGGRMQAFARLDRGGGSVVWQQIDQGDVSDAIDGNSLILVGLQTNRTLFSRFDVPAIFTPNDDGANDVAEFAFSLVLVGDSREVGVDVYDLAGRLIRRFDERREVSAGEYRITWSGDDDAGQRVPPGIYTLRFHVDADAEGADLDQRDILRTIAVAY